MGTADAQSRPTIPLTDLGGKEDQLIVDDLTRKCGSMGRLL